MGLFDGRSYSTSDINTTHKTHSHSHRASSPARSHVSSKSGGGGYFVRPHNPRSSSYSDHEHQRSSSFFGSNNNHNHRSTSNSWFGGAASSSRGIFSSGGGGSSSYYKRRPRNNYILSLFHKLQRMLKDLWAYARRHPVKAFFAIVVPLLSAGGAVGGLMRQFGVRIPGIGALGGMAGARRMGGGYYGSAGYGGLSGMSGIGRAAGGGGGWMESAGGLMQIAKAFM